jgi:hypothetical protein
MIIYFIIILILFYYLLQDKKIETSEIEEDLDELSEDDKEFLNVIDKITLTVPDETCRNNMSNKKKGKCIKLLNYFTNSLTKEETNVLNYFQDFSQIFNVLHKDFPSDGVFTIFGGEKKKYKSSRNKMKKVLNKMLKIFKPEELKSCCEVDQIINRKDYILK